MAYDIDKTNGTALTTVLDGTVNDAKTDIKLFGRNVSNYGEIMAENLVHMVENFANESAPLKPLIGQLYYNTADSSLNVLVNDAPKTYEKILTEVDSLVTTASDNAAKALVKFVPNGTNTPINLKSFGVLSVDRINALPGDTGEWVITWDTAFSDSDYVVQASILTAGTEVITPLFSNQLPGSIEVKIRNTSNGLDETGVSAIMVTAFGD